MINYSKSFNTNISKNSIDYIERFFLLLSNEFTTYGIITEEVSKSSIIFKRVITQFSRRDALAPLREGKVLTKINKDKIRICYKIRFIKYFLISLVLGVILSVVLGMYMDYNIAFMLKVFIITSLLIYLIGIFIAISKMNNIIKRNMYRAKK